MHNRTNNVQVDSSQYIDVLLPMYNLIEYSDNYLKTSGILWHFYRDVPLVDNNGANFDFTEANTNTKSFNLKVKLTGQTDDDDKKRQNNGTIKISK